MTAARQLTIALFTLVLCVFGVVLAPASLLRAQNPDVEACAFPAAVFGGESGTPVKIESTITVTDSQTIADLQILVDISHTYIGDMVIEVSHGGVTVVLHNGLGGSDQDMLLTYNDLGAPSGSESFTCACAMRPSGPGLLSAFDGMNVAGDWTLHITDTFPELDDGVLNRWCVRSFLEQPVAPPPAVTNLICSAPAGTGVVQLFWTNPTAYDQIEITLDGQPLATVPGFFFTYSTPPLSIPSIVNVCVQPRRNGLLGPARCCMVAVEGVVDLERCVNPATIVSEVFPVISVINVVQNIPIGDLQVVLNLSHTFVGDLLVDLISPAGTIVRLHDGGGFGANDLRLTYWEFGVPPGSMPYDCECPMQPSGPGALTDFVGETTAGQWRLAIVDQFLFDAGVLNSWCLRFFQDTPVFPVADLVCGLGPVAGTAELSWQNPVAYDSIDIFVDGALETTLMGPFAAESLGSYQTIPLAAPATQQICVVPMVAGVAGRQQCCGVNVTLPPVENLVVSTLGGNGAATLSWSNPLAYDSINILLDGALYETLPGTATDYTAAPLAFPSQVEFCVQGVLNSFGSSNPACLDLLVLATTPIEGCASPFEPISEFLPPATSTISITGPGLVLGLEVAINVHHTFIADLEIELTSPAGTTVRLHDHGGGGANDIFVLYSDLGVSHGSASFACGCPMQASGLRGDGSLADFVGQPAAGDWTLTVADTFFLDTGELRYWCLRFTDVCELLPPSDLACAVASGAVNVTWSNNDFYSAIEVERDGLLIASLPGATMSYLDTTAAPGAHRYRVIAHSPFFTCGAPSLRCEIAFGITDIVFQGELPSFVDSTGALVATLSAAGRVVLVIDELTAANLSPPESTLAGLWLALGTFPDNYVLTDDDGLLLAEFHTGDLGLDGSQDQPPIPIYIEAGDTWGFDPPTPFADYDGVENFGIEDGDDSLVTLVGLNSLLGLDLSAPIWSTYYSQDQSGNDFTDRLFPAAVTPDLGGQLVAPIWSGGITGDEYVVGIFYLSTIAPVISQSFEVGGYGGDAQDVVDQYLLALAGKLIPPPGADFRRADYDSDGQVLINDPISVLSFLFGGVPISPICPDSADANDDGAISIADAITMLSYIFGLGDTPLPPAPGPIDCGPDLTDDFLAPCAYDACGS
ncbi:MAG: proprotein convertase P-domain-containing protein [Planctomycetota bacterium]